MRANRNGLREALIAGQEVEGGNPLVANHDADALSPAIRTVTRKGTTYTMNVSRIGRRSAYLPVCVMARKEKADPKTKLPSPSAFAEVRMAEAKPEPEAESSPPPSFGMAIVLSSGDQLFLPEACDPRWLGQVVHALRSGPC